MSHPVTTCPSCQRRTPTRQARCVYCSAPLAPEGGGGEVGHEEPRELGGRPRFVPQADDRTHYLIMEARDPVALSAGQLFVMGRDPHTSLVLRASDVSRQHAEIDWEGDPPRPLLCEVRSSHGTFLNDKRVERGDPQPLRSGDRIRLGASIVLDYLHVSERDLQRELEERGRRETRYFDADTLRRSLLEDEPPRERPTDRPRRPARPRPTPRPREVEPPREPEREPAVVIPTGQPRRAEQIDRVLEQFRGGPLVAGWFSHTPPGSLLRELHDARSSGVLTVFVEGVAPGEVVLVEGRCKDAILGIYNGREAVEVLGGCDEGAYRFHAGQADELRTAPPTAEVDADGLALSGYLGDWLTAERLIEDLTAQRVSGVLTVFDGHETGELVFRHGVCGEASLGDVQGRDALAALLAVQEGAYRLRPDPPRLDLPPTRAVRQAPTRPSGRAPAPGSGRVALRPSGSGRVESGVGQIESGSGRVPSGSGRAPGRGRPTGRRPLRRPTAGRRPAPPPTRPMRPPPGEEVPPTQPMQRRPSGGPLRPPSDEGELPPGRSPLK